MMGEKLAVSVAEAAALLGVSRPTVYQLIRRTDNPLPSFTVGTRRLVPVEGLREWVRKESNNGE